MKDVDDIVIGANGTLWVAPTGTAAPADESAVPGAGWIDVGHLSDEGATVVDSKTLADVKVWDLFYIARRHVTEKDFTIAAPLRQWDKNTVPLAFGGGVITTVTAGHFKFVPPNPEDIDERAVLLDWRDGTKKYRLVVPRMMVTDKVEFKAHRADPADLPLTLSILGTDGVAPWYLLTNDPALNPA